MAIQSFIYHRPDNDVLFESFCLKIFRVHLDLPHLEKFGRRGHRQFGVDLISTDSGRVIGIQCKLKNTGVGLTVQAVDEAIELAKTFVPPLNEFIIATTADRDPTLQAHVIRVSQAHNAVGLFDVVMYAWQDIEEILKQDPELANEVYGVPSIPSAQLSVASYTTFNYQIIAGTSSHAEIDEAAQNITEGKPDVALALLQKLRRDRWEVLTSRERFRVLANIGIALVLTGDAQSAAVAFLEAATHQPTDDDAALSIAAQGHLISGSTEQAYRMASESCSRNPLNERAQIIRIQSAPKEVSHKELSDAIPEVLRSRPNIALALSERAMDENDPAAAERVLRLVKDSSPALHGALGAALLQQGLPAGVQEGMLLLPSDPDRVQEAREHFTKAIDSPNAPVALVGAAHFNRALASLLLRDENQALTDLRSAHEREPVNETYAMAFIAEALRQGEAVSALNAAQELFKNRQTPRSRLLLSIALYDSGGGQARQQALTLLQEGVADLGEAEPEIRLEYMRRTLHLLDVSDSLTDEVAETLIEALPEPLEKGVIKSWILLRMSHQDEAEAEALRTATLLTETTSLVRKREVAVLLSRLHLADQALPIWLQLCSPQAFNEDTVHLLQSAESLGEDNLILDYCSSLRARGIYAPEAAEIEIEVLVRYNELRLAQTVLKSYLGANPHNLAFRLLLLHVAVLQDWPEIVNAYLSSYPAPEEIETVVDGARLVQILCFKGLVQSAVEIAYELVRRFPDEPHSHRSLIISILGFGGSKKNLKLDTPSEVVIGSAVRIRKEGEDASTWIVIEDSKQPEISRDEYPPNHPLAQALIGRKIDDRVTLPKTFVRAQTAVVEEIENKILHRMHQSMVQMNQRFPGESFFESVRIGIGEDSEPDGHELDELIEFHRQLAQGPMEAESLYKERRIPIAALAGIAHKGIPELVESFARDERNAVHCVDGRAEEFQRANGVMGSAREVVLDLTALSTLSLLGGDFDLSRMPAKCIVSEGSLEVVRKLGKSLVEDERVRGVMGFNGERVGMVEINPQTERERAARAMEFVAQIEELCDVVGGRSLARTAPGERKKLIQILGVETAESISIAQERNCPLWTDDYATGILVRDMFPVQRVWTQAVCFWLRDAGIISSEGCDVVTARLCAFNYRFTSVSARTIIVACGLCDWDPEKQPLRGTLDRFEEHGGWQDILVLTASLITSLWREAPLYDSAARVTLRVLDKLSHSTRGLQIIQTILSNLDTIFGLNVIGAKDAKAVIEAWLLATAKGGRIIDRVS